MLHRAAEPDALHEKALHVACIMQVALCKRYFLGNGVLLRFYLPCTLGSFKGSKGWRRLLISIAKFAGSATCFGCIFERFADSALVNWRWDPPGGTAHEEADKRMFYAKISIFEKCQALC